MIVDFTRASAESLPRECDVAVIGAGVAGVILACELARAGRRVVLLESGARRQECETHPANRVEQAGTLYRGAEHGRFRCLGGTSTRWGGALIPFHRADVEPGWPMSFDDLGRHLPRAERIFGLPDGGYEVTEVERALSLGATAAFGVRAAKWPAFSRRNVAHLFRAQLESPRGPNVWINATVTHLELDADRRVRRIDVRSEDRSAALRAEHVVLAAGAIESTRLLLQLDATHEHCLTRHADLLGRYFHDHLSARVGTLVAPRIRALREHTGFRFEQGGMRNVRFELDRSRVPGLPGAFVHVVSQSRAPGGFDALREIFRAVQQRRAPRGPEVLRLARHSGWFARAAWTRVLRRRVLAPDDAEYQLHLVIEQAAVRDNRIRLSEGERDAFGIPLARIEWQVRAADVENFDRVFAELRRFWSQRPASLFGALEPRARTEWMPELADGGGIYHPGGTTRMGASSAEGVVDGDLRMFGVPNLRVLSTSTFPNGGSANPTLMLVLLALRMADDLARRAAN